jgi:hypothetical protein
MKKFASRRIGEKKAMQGGTSLVVVAIVSSISASASAACDTGMVKTNMRWQKEHNAEALQKIAQGCTLMRNGDQNAGWMLVVEGYKHGQRNPLAATLIDDCSPTEAFLAACD